jgi:hypothetical protein
VKAAIALQHGEDVMGQGTKSLRDICGEARVPASVSAN